MPEVRDASALSTRRRCCCLARRAGLLRPTRRLRACRPRAYDSEPMTWLRRVNLERAGARVLVALTLVTLLMVGASALMRVAADDLYSSVATARGIKDAAPRTVYGRWLAAQLSADIPDG